MKAVLAGTVIAEAPEGDLLKIEGNWYFPPASITPDALVESPTEYTCSWKGACQYYSVRVDGQVHTDQAWAYLTPDPSSFARVGTDYSGYVAFAPGVTITS